MQKESGNKPLYEKIYDEMKNEIASGRYKPGEQFPTEAELQQKYEVSRITIRAALEQLANDNIIIRYRGRGTYVSEKKITRSFDKILGFSEMCEQAHVKPDAKVIKCKIEPANAEDIEGLSLSDEEKVLVIERIRYADDMPVALEINRFTQNYLFLLNEDLNHVSLYRLLNEKYNISFVRGPITLQIKRTDFETANYLDVEEGYPLLMLTSSVCDTEGKKAYRSIQLELADKFQFII